MPRYLFDCRFCCVVLSVPIVVRGNVTFEEIALVLDPHLRKWFMVYGMVLINFCWPGYPLLFCAKGALILPINW